MIWLLGGYMWLFIHRPFEVWPWIGAYHVERVYMLATIAYWAFCVPKTWTANRVNLGVLALAVSIVLSTLANPYSDLGSLGVENWFKLLVFYVLLMSSVHQVRDLKILIVAFVAITGLYELHSLREYFCGRGVYRMGTWRMVGVAVSEPNSFAASANYGIPMLLPAALLADKRWQKLALVGLLILALLCISLTGSRTGFAGLLCLAVGAALATRHRWKLIPVFVVASLLVWGTLSENLQNRYMTLIDPSRGPATAEASAKSRKEFFFMAVDIWKDHPILGVGIGGFARESKTEMASHTLYAQTISNLGTVGIVAMLILIVAFFGNYFSGRRMYLEMPDDNNARFCYYVLLATTITVFQLLFFGLGGHNLLRFTWLWYAAFSALALRFLVERQYAAEDELYDLAIETYASDEIVETAFPSSSGHA